MKKSLMMMGLAATMLGNSGCFSFCSAFGNWGDGGSASSCGGMSSETAIALDVITSPIQIAGAACILVVWGTIGLVDLGIEGVCKTPELFNWSSSEETANGGKSE